LFGNHNARVLSASDSALEVMAPKGPITGGAVDVLVATSSGYTHKDDAYRYDVSDYSSEGDFYSGQESYIRVTNLYSSCYGGVGPAGCEGVTFVGQVGVDGQSEFFEFSYPRIHTPGQGWLTGVDSTIEEWNVYPPVPAFPSGIDDLRERVDAFTLTNPAWTSEADVCVDLLDDLVYSPKSCDTHADMVAYDPSVMRFCEGEDAVEGGTYEYRSDWPVNRDFFAGDGAPDDPVLVQLDVASKGISGVELMLPPPLVPLAESGFSSSSTWWAGGMASCMDSNGDGEASLDEDGVVFTWEPMSQEELLEGSSDQVLDINSYIHVSVTFVELGWFGLELTGLRGATTVPDTFRLNSSGDTASVGIPNSVMYQLSSPNLEWSSYNSFSGKGTLGSYDSGASYMFMEIYRITDYKVQTDDGPLIFSYVTGDLTIPSWNNPIEDGDSCSDCVDGDGDGWVDDLDPDCNSDEGGGLDEVNLVSSNPLHTCNDGLDNDNNGLVDAEDPLCESGWDGETTCADGEDNDGDGWTDVDDADCDDLNSQEDGLIAGGTCSDGLDNEGDGWIDAKDVGCVDGRDDEDDGFLGTACNDGIDNDLHGDADAMDPYCDQMGADSDSEEPVWISRCVDGDDNDGDGFFDDLDPDCEYVPHSRESLAFHTPDTYPLVAACYDGEDNDGDGQTDADDPSCWSPVFDFFADGFINDEAADWGTGCSDGVDSDADGWPDGADPDCVAGDASTQEELGFGDTLCNNGIDDDNDGLIDAMDVSYCKKATDNYEGPG